MTAVVEMTGRRFGRLVVVERAPSWGASTEAFWRCVCECGGETSTRGGSLRSGDTQSCGCYASERTIVSHFRHGFCETAEYQALQGAKKRCGNSRNPQYANYGGRGIRYSMPDDLGEATALLLATLGPRPEGMSLDRIDTNGHYEIGNLRWATQSQQQQNRRYPRTWRRNPLGRFERSADSAAPAVHRTDGVGDVSGTLIGLSGPGTSSGNK